MTYEDITQLSQILAKHSFFVIYAHLLINVFVTDLLLAACTLLFTNIRTMRLSPTALLLIASLWHNTIPFTTATPTPAITTASLAPLDNCNCSLKNPGLPPAFFLAGDSTAAINGGWGNGFLSFILPKPGQPGGLGPAWGVNLARSGRTTASFVSSGDWGKVISNLKNITTTGNKYQAYVTIQFGHNDQKEASGISLQKYQANLENLANEVRKFGGIPLLVTPLTRRAFSGNKVVENLANERAATIAAAAKTKSYLVDLNAASTWYINALGKDQSQVFNLAQGDRTHLNGRGEVVFGRMMVDLLLGRSWGWNNNNGTASTGNGSSGSCDGAGFAPGGSCLGIWFREDKEMSQAIWDGRLPAGGY